MAYVSVDRSADFATTGSCMPVSSRVPEEFSGALPDEELVERSLSGEEEAFRRLYHRYRLPVYAAVCRIVPDPEEARDATQEVFITVYRSLAIWNPQRADFLPWIYKVATNRAIDYWRVKRRRAEVPLAEMGETPPRGASLDRRTMEPMERMVERKERMAQVRRFLKALPKPQQRFIVLRYRDGLKLKEIADKEGCKIGTVKSTLYRATRAMRSKLGRLYKQSHSQEHKSEYQLKLFCSDLRI